MTMNKLVKTSILTASFLYIGASGASAADNVYANFPITLKDYDVAQKHLSLMAVKWPVTCFTTVSKRQRRLAI